MSRVAASVLASLFLAPLPQLAQPVASVPLRPVHTYSIVARDPATGSSAWRSSRTGSRSARIVPWAEAGVGAVATQSFVDPSYGPLGLALMRPGRSAPDALKGLLAADAGREVRQVAMIDAAGRVAAHTGARCMPAAGAPRRDGLLRPGEPDGDSAAVWPAMAKAFEAAKGDLAERMLAALDAAEAAGGRHPRTAVGGPRRRQRDADGPALAGPASSTSASRTVPAPLAELRRLVTLCPRLQPDERGRPRRREEGRRRGAEGLLGGAGDRPRQRRDDLLDRRRARRAWGRSTRRCRSSGRRSRIDRSWAEMTPRLPKAGLLPDDPALIARIVAVR